MRLTVATLLLASIVSCVSATAHPQSVEGARGHDAVAKRHRSRALTTNGTHVADIPHKIRFPGDHDIRDVPDALEWDEEYLDTDADKAPWFSDGFDDDWEGSVDKSENGTTSVITDREWEEHLQTRAPIKRGLAWTNEVMGSVHLLGKLFGGYTWTEWYPDEFKKNGVRFFAMLKTYEKRDKFKNTVNHKGASVNYIMGCNEVNLKSQANMSPGRYAWIHRTYLKPLKKKFGWKIVGPSTANGPSAIAWYKELKRIAPDVFNDIDIINLHYYGLDYKLVQNWLRDWYNMFHKKIWLTEYGCHSFSGKGSCSASQAQNFMRQIAIYCNNNWWCESHMIYGAYVNSRTGLGTKNALFYSKNSLSALGKAYISI